MCGSGVELDQQWIWEELACVCVQRTSRKMRIVRRAGKDCRRVDVKVGTGNAM